MERRYGLAASWLHWLAAILIIAMIPLGKYMAGLDISPDKALLYRLHAASGLIVLLLTLWRVALALHGPRPPADPAWPASMARASRAAHVALYLLLLLLAASGIATMALSDLGAALLAGDLAGWPDLADVAPANGHEILANLLILVLVLHVAAALYHQYWLRDRLFDRLALRRA